MILKIPDQDSNFGAKVTIPTVFNRLQWFPEKPSVI